MSLLQDSNRDGVMSQIVKRLTEIEEYVRLHKIIKHQNLTVPDSNPEVVYAYGDPITVLTSETTIFSITAPANQFSALSGHLRFIVNTFFDGSGSARTLTARLKVGATTISEAVTVSASTNYRHIYEGEVSRLTVDSQNLEFIRTTAFETGGSLGGGIGNRGAAAEDDASPMTIAFTLQLSGAVDVGRAYGVYVEWINDADMW
jgi:hypothetical protein